jgi:predicted 3-demethylubiquinone-9 3-methyltransferase (glyoxalase superfamily)
MPSITPFLWFDGRVGEAVEFYTRLFDDPESGATVLVDSSPGPDGDLFMATLRLFGQEFMILNGGPHYTLNPAFSMFLSVEGQEQVDHYWNALCDGGEPGPCGWLVDRFGLSWQVIPTALMELMGDPDPEKSGRVREAMLAMGKIDVAGLQAAYDG